MALCKRLIQITEIEEKMKCLGEKIATFVLSLN